MNGHPPSRSQALSFPQAALRGMVRPRAAIVSFPLFSEAEETEDEQVPGMCHISDHSSRSYDFCESSVSDSSTAADTWCQQHTESVALGGVLLTTSEHKKKQSKKKKKSLSSKKTKKSVRFADCEDDDDNDGRPSCTAVYETIYDDEDSVAATDLWWTDEEMDASRLYWRRVIAELQEDDACVAVIDKLWDYKKHSNIERAVRKLEKSYPLARGLETYISHKYRSQCFVHIDCVLDANDEVYQQGLQNTDEGRRRIRHASRENSRKLQRWKRKLED